MQPVAPAPQPQWKPPGPTAGQPAVSSGLKMGIGIASVFVPLLGLIMGIVYMVDANPEKKAAGKLWLMLACAGMVMYCMIGVLGNQAIR
jgi:hypothetical protein